MLRELSVENLALIDSLRLSFGGGFTVLTGETGAGKSIIIDALNAVLGERVGADAVREGQARAMIEAVFDASDAPRALDALERAGLRDGDDTIVILSREIAGGRSTYRINRRVATLGVLQDVGRHLVDIHGQHEHQTLIHEENHLSFLDVFGGPEHLALRREFEAQYQRFVDAGQALSQLHLDERERAQRSDLLRFQVQEIEAAQLTADEEETLGAERLRLQHAERLREALTEAHELLDGERDEGLSALAAAQMAAREVSAAAKLAPELAEIAGELESATVVLGEIARSLAGYLHGLEADPDRLEQIEERLALIARLKRKYGDTIAEILEFGERCARELADLQNVESRIEELRAEREAAREAAGKAAVALSHSRQALADKLAAAVVQQLHGLGMPAAQFQMELGREEDPDGLPGEDRVRYRATRRGIDQGRFLFTANAGEPLRPLSKVASGGELSRLMLVFKSICSRGAEIPTLVFDEVDAGIGGRVANAVAERLAAVAAGGQVLCVTHLPQIARLADHHIRVEKCVEGGRTVIRAQSLAGEERVSELARMLGAEETDQAARRHAEKLLRDARPATR
jgi:DNA repair protein RecN (Recombination protein N)